MGNLKNKPKMAPVYKPKMCTKPAVVRKPAAVLPHSEAPPGSEPPALSALIASVTKAKAAHTSESS